MWVPWLEARRGGLIAKEGWHLFWRIELAAGFRRSIIAQSSVQPAGRKQTDRHVYRFADTIVRAATHLKEDTVATRASGHCRARHLTQIDIF